MRPDSFRVAAIQASPVFLDLERTLEKACRLIEEAATHKADLALFPEAFVSGYPMWVWFIPPGRTADLRSAYAALHASAISIPSDATERLCEAAKTAGIAIAIPVNERNSDASGMSVFNTLLYIGPDGAILGKHRKLVPTGGERLVWASGDGSDLQVYTLPFARMSGLICWEHYMPLARYALAAWGEQIHLAPTWDRGEPWTSTLRHVAKEGRAVVIGCCQAIHKREIPDALPFKAKYLSDIEGWINPGGSVIVDPDGKIVAGPALEIETILYADFTTEQLVGPRWQLDAGGHYARPDVFELRVHRDARPLIRDVHSTDAQRKTRSIKSKRRRPA